MLKLQSLTLRRGTRPLFEQVSLTIFPGQRVGVTGANGTSKSSLFALLRGELHADSGDVQMPPKWVIAHVAQETPGVDSAAIDYALDGDAELREVEAALAAAEADPEHCGLKLGELHARYEAIGGWGARVRAAQLLAGLGFRQEELTRPVASFSGGWRMRLNLARALMCRSDLLLLDEPTNHLDLDAVIWLEGWLRAYPGTLLLISHDRDFLDNVVDGIAHIEQLGITLYPGNYAAFERQRAEKLAQQQLAFEKQQREIAHLQKFIDRFRAQATKARQAQSRIKALDRMELISAAHVDSPFGFEFAPPKSMPHPLLALDEACVGYGDQPVLAGLNLDIQPGTRLGLLGPNGAGKSTLIKLLAGRLPLAGGVRREGQGLAIGYFAQHQLEELRPERTAVQHVQALSPNVSEQDIRNFLGGFDFRGERALEPIEPFSGGEKARLALALIVWQRPNLLLLDEPTNHLDLDMRHALNVALQDYEGALIVVSHDRHLLRTTTDAFLIVGHGRARPFDGDLDDYRDWLAEREKAARAAQSAQEDAQSKAAGGPSAAEKREQKRADAESRQRLAQLRKPVERELAKVEKTMEKLNAEKATLETALADPGLYAEAQKAKLRDALARQATLARELESAEERWLELQEEIEAINARG